MRSDLKYALIRAGLNAVRFSGAGRLAPFAGGRGVIFTLHHVRPRAETSCFEPNAILSVTPEFLAVAIRAALAKGLVPAHLHDLPTLLADPRDTRKFVAFTLDDGYRDNAVHAAPVFRAFGVPYTIFVTQGFVERTRGIWWETAAALARRPKLRFDFGAGEEEMTLATEAQKRIAFARLAAFVRTAEEDEAVRRIEECARAEGVDPRAIVEAEIMDAGELRALASDPLARFGAHGVTHVNLRRVSPERLKDEIAQSTEAVERYVGARPLTFSYPYGWASAVGERERRAAAAAGFAAAVTTQPGVLGRPEPHTGLPRISLNGYFQKKRYVEALLSGLPGRLWGLRGRGEVEG